MNRALNDYEHLKKEVSLLTDRAKISDGIILELKGQVSRRDSVITLNEQKFFLQDSHYKGEIMKVENKNKKLKKLSIGVGVGGSIIGFLIGLLIT